MEKPMAVVLVGGLGTRLRPLTYKVPKPLVMVNGKPFLNFVLEKIASMGIRECILLTGYKHAMVKRYCGNGSKWGLRISYSRERTPLGTGGAILAARAKIKKTALVLNGDSFADFDIAPFLSFHRRKKGLSTIFAMHGSLSARGALTISKEGRVKEFLEKQKEGIGYFNTGAYMAEPRALSLLASTRADGRLGNAFSMEKEGFQLFASMKKLYGYPGHGRFLDIGTFESLSKAGRTVDSGGIARAAKKSRGAAIFLDRDGVVNRHRHDRVKHPGEFVFEEGAIPGILAISKLGLPMFIVTNQSMVGRGIATHETLAAIHGKMLSELRMAGISIADILVCPHAPHEGCACRKPKTGMLLDAKERFGLDLSASFVIGDSTSDIAMGNAAGCTTILVGTGLAGKDGLHMARHSHFCKNLPEAAKTISSILKRRKNKRS